MVVDAVMDRIIRFAKADAATWKEYSDNAFDVAKIALWKNNVKYYEQAYRKALEEVVHRRGEFPEYSQDQAQKFVQYKVNAPTWKNIMINKNLPKRLEHLDTLSKNRRVSEPEIMDGNAWTLPHNEFNIHYDEERIAAAGLDALPLEQEVEGLVDGAAGLGEEVLPRDAFGPAGTAELHVGHGGRHDPGVHPRTDEVLTSR